MQSKLEELTQKIYSEGVSKANDEAERVISMAKKEATDIISKAQKEANVIVDSAKSQAEELKKNVVSEIKLSGKQAVSAIKQEITNLILTKLLSSSTRESFQDKDFIKKLIETVIQNWNPRGAESVDLTVLLPKEEQEESIKSFLQQVANSLNSEVQIEFKDGFKSGFKIGPQDGSYILSFSDKDFEQFFRTFLRPQIERLLFTDDK